MIDVKFNCRTFLNHRNQVVVRARWNKKRSEVGFSIGLHADPSKWNADTQRPVRGSIHVCGQKRIPSRVINGRNEMFLVAVDFSRDLGDVNDDGEVKIADVSNLIDVIWSK